MADTRFAPSRHGPCFSLSDKQQRSSALSRGPNPQQTRENSIWLR